MSDGTLLDGFAAAVATHGDKTALVEQDGTCVSFSELAARADGIAAAWSAKGLKKGHRVLVAMPISADLYASLAALWSLGAIAVLPEPAMGLRGVRHAVQLAGCQGLAAKGPYMWLKALLPKLWSKPLYHPTPVAGTTPSITSDMSDTALISFTSGSTGLPKAIARSHGFLRAQETALAPLLNSERDETDLVAFPVFALLNLAAGRTSVLPNEPMRKLAETGPHSLANWIERQGVTRALIPPAMCDALASARPLPQLHTVFTGGGPVFPDMIDRLLAMHNDLRIVAVYGSTEAEPIAHLDTRDMTPDDRAAMANGAGLLAGQPVDDVRIRIDNSEILVTGEHVNKGYLDPARDAETKLRDGDVIWHRTGDSGRLDKDGRLWLLGRHGADVGGLHPFVVEAAARLWPGVKRAALAELEGAPVLALEGDETLKAIWQEKATIAFGIADIRHLAIPLDRRHNSKVDYPALRKALA